MTVGLAVFALLRDAPLGHRTMVRASADGVAARRLWLAAGVSALVAGFAGLFALADGPGASSERLLLHVLTGM